MENVLGIDIGGSGIKGALVDVSTGALTAERFKVSTPKPALPDAVAAAVNEVVTHFGWTGLVGCTFPGLVMGGKIWTAPNLNAAWVGQDGPALFGKATGGRKVILLNDADAAGLAEMSLGAGVGQSGTVFALTFGTGIGSAQFFDGVLIPNTEVGHIEIRGMDAERRASASVREEQGLCWTEWAKRVEEYLQTLEMLFSPSLFIIGGGVSRKAEKFIPLLTSIRARIVPASMCNNAGIVGAAMAAVNAE